MLILKGKYWLTVWRDHWRESVGRKCRKCGGMFGGRVLVVFCWKVCWEVWREIVCRKCCGMFGGKVLLEKSGGEMFGGKLLIESVVGCLEGNC
jgi:hypothetical protein